MEFKFLSEFPNQEICLLEFRTFTVLVDCFLPISKECDSIRNAFHVKRYSKINLINLKEVDCVLISNHVSILGLPFIMKKLSDKVRIFASEPTRQIGRKMMQELAFYGMEAKSNPCFFEGDDFLKVLLDEQKDSVEIYKLEDIEHCFNKIQSISFGEESNLFGEISVIGVSSGFSIGGCNWIIKTQNEKVLYISSSCTTKGRHPKSLLTASVLTKGIDIAIVSNIFNSFAPAQAAVLMWSKKIQEVISQNGNVMIPCYSSGLIYDLLEYLSMKNKDTNLSIYCISPIMKFSLKYANISFSYLCEERRKKVLAGKDPFLNETLIKEKRLLIFEKINKDFLKHFEKNKKKPSVYFVGHPSLKAGPVIELMNLLDEEKNVCILIEPEYINYASEFAKKKIKILKYPVDIRLSQKEIIGLMQKSYKPKTLLMPKTMGSKIETNDSNFNVVREDSGRINVKRKYSDVIIDPSLSQNLFPKRLKRGTFAFSRISGEIYRKNGESFLLESKSKGKKRSFQKMLLGKVNVRQVVAALRRSGFKDVQYYEVKKGQSNYMIEIESVGSIELENGATTINIDEDEMRDKARKAILKLYTQV